MLPEMELRYDTVCCAESWFSCGTFENHNKTAMNKPLLVDLVWKAKNYKYLFSDVTDVFNNAL